VHAVTTRMLRQQSAEPGFCLLLMPAAALFLALPDRIVGILESITIISFNPCASPELAHGLSLSFRHALFLQVFLH
jgi:hypothetical protein